MQDDVPFLKLRLLTKQTTRNMNLRVLLVDDDVQLRAAISQLLWQQNFQVVTARDGRDAIAQLLQAQPPFDLVISNVEMPRLDGWGLLDWVRHQETALPVVLMSALSGRSFVNAANDRGARGVLEKPLLASQLRKLIEALFDPQGEHRPNGFYFPPTLATQVSYAAVCA
jgi:DNA-binding response OmpR family regulator